jgi:curved DNA-binding protein CbpA
MSLEEARAVLGVPAGATREEIRAAYTRLMRSVHPDKGGTAGLAAQLNAARDRLLGK